jgi:hypothetical protein
MFKTFQLSISARGPPLMPSEVAMLLAVPSGKIASGGPFALAPLMTLVPAPSPPGDDDQVGPLPQATF